MKNKKMKRNKNKYIESFRKLYSINYIINMSIIVFLTLFFLDYYNLPSKILKFNSLIFISVFILLLIKIIEIKPFTLLKLKTVNYIDLFIEVLKNSITLYSLYVIFVPSWYKIVVSLSLMIILCIVELYRIQFINKEISGVLPKNVYDLKDLYEGKIPNTTKLVLLNEKDVDYDLLGRDNLINMLNNTIINCNTDDKFVIAIEGKWGCGKTTILNNLKRSIIDDNIIIIDDFDPWSYEDEKSLFRGMFDSIMGKTGINFSLGKFNDFLNSYLDTIFYNSKYEKVYSLLKKRNNDNNEINRIKEIINDFLRSNNKKVVFIIDNIERAEKENIIFLFKLINNILNFENTVYLLSFDDEKMKKIFNEDLNIDYSYLRKIIQLEIKIPSIDETILSSVVSTCLNNLFNIYSINEITNQDLVFISKNITDLRELKRYINSVISFQYKTNRYLNCSEVILLSILQRETPELYNQIQKNKKFFVSEDTIFDQDIYTLDNYSFNEEGKSFFSNLLNNVDYKYQEILSRLFPYVNNYLKGKDLKEKNGHNGDYKDSIINKRIYNARYFDLYFSQNQNDFTKVNEAIDEFIDTINTSNDHYLIEKKYVKMLFLYNNSFQKFILEMIEMQLNKITDDKKFILLNIIYNNLSRCDDSTIFLGLNSYSRAIIIISDLVINICDNEFKEFLTTLKSNYSSLYIIHELIYWIENDKNNFDNKDYLIAQLNTVSNELVSEIINNRINLLDDNNYAHKNIWGFYFGTKNDEKLRKNYISSILNENTVFRFLNELVGRSVGNQYGYSIQDDNINTFSTRENIDAVLERITRPLTEDENLLLNIFKNHHSMRDGFYLNYDKEFKV